MTYSIVARDKKTGFLGVAVQSHYFSVGPVVPWARSGVGAVATQSMVEMKYGPLGLDLMSGGKSAAEALESLLRTDPKSDTRQVGMVDANGVAATHTGNRCIDYAGHVTGDGFTCQANLMSNDAIWGEMKQAYENNSSLEFPERLLAALEAAENTGGDARGKQSVAILIVSSQIYPNPWMGRVLELRVEDNPNPLEELSRLLRLRRSYDLADKGDDLLTSGKIREAGDAYAKALEFAPGNEEILYWKGVMYLGSSLKEEGVSILKEIFRNNKNWVMITKSLLRKGLIPKSREIEDLVGTE
ncbi:MAG: DUF1028 domain-containing protein [Nitrososphaerota archaeon]|nr:DUF1028 domain-containing protein [Nitrososphaerota archaeon]